MSSSVYSVWIEDSLEANSHYLTLEKAKELQYELKLDGYNSEIRKELDD